MTKDGVPVGGGTIRIPIRLMLPKEPDPPSPPTIADPDWLPSKAAPDVLRYYPEAAQKIGQEGAATVQCTISIVGALFDCRVISESPVGLGFGAAAMKMTPLFRMKPRTKSGQPVEGGTVNIPMRFQLPRG